MSRRNTFPSLSSSRQIMMAWKVSGLSQSPAIMASRPASMRLAMAISPSRERSYRAHFAQIHADGVVGALGGLFGRGFGRKRPLLDLHHLAVLALGLLLGLLAGATCSSGSASSVSTTLTPISLNFARMSSICSDLTSSEDSNALIWSWVT